MDEQSTAPKFENAPGVVVRRRASGSWVAVWQCRTDIAEMGFTPRTVALWKGWSPSRLDQIFVSDRCISLQNEMLTYGHGGIPPVPSPFDGTIRALISNYKSDGDSSYHALRYRTRENYDSLMRRLERDLGDDRIEALDARKIKRTHEGWMADGHIAMAHSLVAMLRILCTYGATMLKSAECRALKADLSDMKFKMPKPREEALTSEHASAIIAKAHEIGLPELALAQAIQFECTLRQKDVIGEWVPKDEPGLSDVTYASQKWLRGLRWNEIDGNLILRHTTSKRQKDIQVDLRLAPMVLQEFNRTYGLDLATGIDRSKLPATGPVICYRGNDGRPFVTPQFRRLWRKVADLAGIPKTVRNMDSRAGAITEATEAGADLESIKHAATHSDIKMTSRYSRHAAEKTATVMQKRVAFRQNKTGK